MFGRSNSLSINTGTANSTLYASSSSPPLTSSSSSNTSPPIHPTQNPRRSGPSLLGNSIYSHKSTPGPSNLRNEWSDWTDAPPAPDPDRSHDHRKQFTHGSKEAEQVATVAAFPHFDPNWTPPAGPGATSAGAQSTATGNNAPPPLPQAGPAFGTLSNNVLAPRPAQSSAFAFGTQSSSVSTPLPTQSSAFAFGAQSSNASTPRPTQSFAFGTQSSNVPPPSRAPAVGTQPNILQRFSVGIQDNKFLSQTPTTGTQSNNILTSSCSVVSFWDSSKQCLNASSYSAVRFRDPIKPYLATCTCVNYWNSIKQYPVIFISDLYTPWSGTSRSPPDNIVLPHRFGGAFEKSWPWIEDRPLWAHSISSSKPSPQSKFPTTSRTEGADTRGSRTCVQRMDRRRPWK
jgi:hypothetical protein